MTNGNYTAAYSYLANAPLVSQIAFRSNTVTRMTTTKSYDLLNRLTRIASVPGGTGVAPVSFTYQYNAANQRTALTNADNARWVYTYDALGQVISGKKYWSDGTPVAGQHFEYAFDDIGNRQSTKAGGDNSGANLRPASYLNNSLNQILSREVPSYVNVLATASNTATVTLWGDNGSYSTTSRKGEYFRGELYANNATGAVWLTITNVAVLNNGANPDIVTNAVGRTFVPKTAETFGYDADGNRTNDGRWTLTWDAENRLVRLVAATSTGPQQRIDFAYDWQGRRIGKKVWNNTAGTGNPAVDERFVYDGWNVIAVLNAQSSILKSFMWGLDLSGTQQGAGGVGGLVKVFDQPANKHYFPGYDGNGNVVLLVNGDTGEEAARYEYGPFGENLRVTGPVAKANPFRFSTKFQDDEADLLYYGHRYYDPGTGRWLSRDPINEPSRDPSHGTMTRRGLDGEFIQLVDWLEEQNLTRFVFNDPVNGFDPLGLKWSPGWCCNLSSRTEWALVGGSGSGPQGRWKRLPPKRCTWAWQDCDGMTCGGGFYWVGLLEFAVCITPGCNSPPFDNRRWTPDGADPDGRPPETPEGSDRGRGSAEGNTPPGYQYGPRPSCACKNPRPGADHDH